jgi:ribosomal protein L16 Arg81 hydroxylase
MGDARRRALAQQAQRTGAAPIGSTAGSSVLSALVAPHSSEEFLSRYWPGKVFVAHGDPARLPAFLRSPELASVEALSAAYRGATRFCSGRSSYTKMAPGPQVPAISLYRMGLTVQFEDIAPWVAQAQADLRRLEADLGINSGAARASAFASPVSEGLGLHFDTYDLFSVQLRGGKRFHVAPVDGLVNPVGNPYVPGSEPMADFYPQAVNGFPDPGSAQFTCIEMQPGSVLYLPRSTWHYTESAADSLSVSICLFLSPVADFVVRQLYLMLLQDPRWRRPMYGAWGGDSMRSDASAHMAELLADLPVLAGRLTAEELMSNLMPLEQRLEAITPRDRFQKTPHSRLEVEAPPSPVVSEQQWMSIKLQDPEGGERSARVQVSRRALPVFCWIAEKVEPFAAGDLAARFPDLPFSTHREILRAATTAGLVKLLWYPAIGA